MANGRSGLADLRDETAGLLSVHATGAAGPPRSQGDQPSRQPKDWEMGRAASRAEKGLDASVVHRLAAACRYYRLDGPPTARTARLHVSFHAEPG